MPPQAPHRPCSGQTPSTSSIFQRFCVSVNITTNRPPATPPVTSAPIGCIRSEPAQTATSPASGPLCTKPGSFLPATSATSVPPTMAISEFMATRPEILSRVCALMTLKPNQPTVRIQAPSARKGMRRRRVRRDAAVLGGSAAPRAEQQHGGQPDPAAHGMHHHRAGEVVELLAEAGLQPGLDAEGLVPGDALEEGIDEADQQEGGGELRAEARALGDAAGDDGRDRGGEGQQEEELDQS
jgi:hypothetical protein